MVILTELTLDKWAKSADTSKSDADMFSIIDRLAATLKLMVSPSIIYNSGF